MVKHLRETDQGYWKHWWRAVKISAALLVHAFLPDVLTDYASKELCDDKYKKMEAAMAMVKNKHYGPWDD